MEVYGLCLGGNVFGWTADKEASFAVLDAYVEAGGNFIDTADTYMRPNMGQSERIIGEWMASRGNRDELVIATKVGSDGGLSAENIAAHVDGSLERLQTDRIDLYYAHKDDGSVGSRKPCARSTRRCATARCCRSRRPTCRRSACASRCELAEPSRASLPTRGCSRTTTSSSARATSATTRRSSRDGLSVAPYYALASGFLTGKYRDGDGDSPRAETALATSTSAAVACSTRSTTSPPHMTSSRPRSRSRGCAAKPSVVAPIASARSPDQLADVLPGATLQLTDDEVARLDEASA